MNKATPQPSTVALPHAFATKAAFATWHAAACAEPSPLVPEDIEESLSQAVWGPAQKLWETLLRAGRKADAHELELRINGLVGAVDTRLAMPVDCHDEIKRAWGRATEKCGGLVDWIMHLQPLQNVPGVLTAAASRPSPRAPGARRTDVRAIDDFCALTVNCRTGRVDYRDATGATTFAQFSGNSLKILWCLADPTQPRKTTRAIWKEGWSGHVGMHSVAVAKDQLKAELKSRPQNCSLWADLARRIKSRKRLYFVDLSLTGRL